MIAHLQHIASRCRLRKPGTSLGSGSTSVALLSNNLRGTFALKPMGDQQRFSVSVDFRLVVRFLKKCDEEDGIHSKILQGSAESLHLPLLHLYPHLACSKYGLKLGHPTIARSQSRLTAIVSIFTTRHRKTTVIGLKKTKAQSLSSSL